MNILTMILAGGTGEELSVLIEQRAKTAVPFGGRYRIVDFVLSNCVHSGIHDIAVLAQYSPKSLLEHIRMGKPWDLDRKASGVNILQPTYHGEAAHWYLGTADALVQNADIIRESKADLILVLSGDQVYVMDYRRMVEAHQRHGKPVTIAIKAVRPSQRSRFGMVRCAGDGTVTAFTEKPKSSSYRHASLGIYLFDREYLIGMLGDDRIDIVFDIVIPELQKRRVASFVFDGYWEDIGSLASYFRASRRLIKHRSLITNPAWPIFTRGSDLPPAHFFAGSSVHDSIIGDGCLIKGTVKGSILSPGVRVERGAVVEDSVIFSSAVIGAHARVRRSILDKAVSVGSRARIGFESRGMRRRPPAVEAMIAGKGAKGLTVVGKGTRLSPGTILPAGTLVRGRAKV